MQTNNKVDVLVTGVAGFIGYHLAKKLLDNGCNVLGIDNLNTYYDQDLKKDRLSMILNHPRFKFVKCDLSIQNDIMKLFKENNPEVVVNLAAQAGVRYSIDNPHAYLESNIAGFLNILEACRNFPVKHLLYASSSSVYGGNKIIPFSTNHNVDHPVSLYAATKKSNELMAHTYSHLYNIPTTGLRFFTVYGPWGRPDMAYFSFTKNIIENKPIKIFNHGEMERDFTYVDDIVDGIIKLITNIPQKNLDGCKNKDELSSSTAPYKIFNLGNSKPVKLMEFIKTIERSIGKEAKKEYLEMQPGDVTRTYADVSDLEKQIGFKPETNIETGMQNFVDWYINYYNIKL